MVAIDNCLGNRTLSAILYNLSILSGPLVACVFGSFICLLPIHNVLKEPAYWYEEVLCRMLSSGFLVACQTTVEAEFWSNFRFEKRLTTYVFLVGLMYTLFSVCVIGYYYIWTVHLGFYQPGGLNHFIVGSISVIVVNIALWFRYGNVE